MIVSLIGAGCRCRSFVCINAITVTVHLRPCFSLALCSKAIRSDASDTTLIACRKRSKVTTLQWDVRRTPLYNPARTSPLPTKYTPVLAASLTALYHRNFTYGHLFRSLRAVQGYSAPQPGLKPSVRIRISSRRAFMIRSMLVPLWLRRVQLWLCTLSVETNVCAVPSKPCFRCCSLTVYPRPPDRVSFSILLGSTLFQVCTVCLVLYLLISTQWAALYVNI
jgi:hypothetical protein